MYVIIAHMKRRQDDARQYDEGQESPNRRGNKFEETSRPAQEEESFIQARK